MSICTPARSHARTSHKGDAPHDNGGKHQRARRLDHSGPGGHHGPASDGPAGRPRLWQVHSPDPSQPSVWQPTAWNLTQSGWHAWRDGQRRKRTCRSSSPCATTTNRTPGRAPHTVGFYRHASRGPEPGCHGGSACQARTGPGHPAARWPRRDTHGPAAHLHSRCRGGLCQALSQCRVVVTCRTLSYQDPAWQLADFQSFTIAPFTEAQIDRFIVAWYAELARLGSIKRGAVAGVTRQLQQGGASP